MSYKDRIESMSGLSLGVDIAPTEAQALELFKEGIRDIVKRSISVDPKNLHLFSKIETDLSSTTGIDIESGVVLAVLRENGDDNKWVPAFEVNANLKGQVVVASGSIYESTKHSPVWFWSEKKVELHPKPTGITGNKAEIIYVHFSDTNSSDVALDLSTSTDIGYFPKDKEDYVVIYTSIKAIEHAMGQLREDTIVDDITFDSPPVAPTLDEIVGNIPIYTAPANMVLPSSLSDADIDFTDVPSAPGFIAPVLSLTTLSEPADLNITTSLPSIPVLSDISVTFSESPPEYIKPILSLDSLEVFDWTLPSLPVMETLGNITSSLPSFTTPGSIVMPVSLSDLDIDWNTYGVTEDLSDYPTLTTSSVVLPVIELDEDGLSIEDISFSESQPVAPNLTASSVSFSNPSPSYVPPVAPVFDFSEVAQVLTEMDIPSDIVLPVLEYDALPSITWNFPAVPVAPTLNVTTIANFSSFNPNFIPPVMENLDWSDTENWITNEEDSEMLSSRIQEIQSKVGEYSAKLQASTADFSKDNTIYQAELQKVIQEAQLEDANEARKLQLYGSKVQTYSAEVSNIIQENTSKVGVWQNEWSLKTQKYSAEVSAMINKYQADSSNKAQLSQSQVAVYNAQLSKVSQEFQLDMNKYQAELQSALNGFNEENVTYQAALQIAMQEAQLEDANTSKELQKYSNELQAYQTAVNSDITEWQQKEVQAKVLKYQTEYQGVLQKYQADTSSILSKYSTDIQQNTQEYQAESQAYTQQVNNALQAYQAESGYDMSKYQAEVQEAVQKHNADLQSETADFNSTLQAYQADVAQINADNQLIISKYSSALQAYQGETSNLININQAKLGEWQQAQGVKLQEYNANIQNELNNFNKEQVEYQAKLQIAIQNAQLESSDDAQKLQLYGAELSSYQADVSTEVQEYTINELNKELEIWKTQLQSDLQVYSAGLQVESSRISNEMAIYQQAIQKALQEYQAETGYDISKYQAEVQATTSEFTNDLQNATSEYQQDLAGYQAEVQTVSQGNQEELAKYNAELQSYNSKVQADSQEFNLKLQKDTAQYQWMVGHYQQLKQQYNEAFGITQASNRQGE